MLRAGYIYYCDFGMNNNSIQWGKRPCIIVDNAMACAFSPCIHCVPLTTQDKKKLPLHYKLQRTEDNNLTYESTALCEQYQLIDKKQLIKFLGKISQEELVKITDLCKKNFPLSY